MNLNPFHVLVISLTLTCFSLWNIYWLSNNLSTFSTKEIWNSIPDPASGFLFFFRWLLLWKKSRSNRSIKASIIEETLSAQITRCKNARRTRQCTKQHGYLFSWIISHFWSRSRCMSGDAPELRELIKYRPFVWHEESKNMSVVSNTLVELLDFAIRFVSIITNETCGYKGKKWRNIVGNYLHSSWN